MGLEKINKFKRERNWTNEDLAVRSGVPKSTIDKITSGKTYDPKLETVRAIADALGKTLNDFDDTPAPSITQKSALDSRAQKMAAAYFNLDDYGKDVVDVVIEKEALRYNEQKHTESSIPVTLPMYTFNTEAAAEMITLPLATMAFAGGHGDYADDDSFENTDVRLTMTTRRADFLIRVSGHSMEPDYPDGCTVAVQAQDDIKVGQVGVFVVDGAGYVKVKGKEYLESINPEGNEVLPALDGTIKCLGLVLGVVD